MGYSKLSVTVPDNLYIELKELSIEKKMKFSHLVTDALTEKINKYKEELLIKQINKAFEDSDISDEQHSMAEAIANSIETDELPW